MKKILTISFFLFSMIISSVCFAGQIELLRTNLVEGEALTVKITYQDKNKLDFTPLSNNYRILSQSQNENVSLVNNRVSSTKFITLELMPKDTAKGSYKLPSIMIDGEKTQEIAYTVNAPSETEKDGILFQGEIIKNAGIEGGQIIYKITVFDGLGLMSGTINASGTGNFMIEQMNESDSHMTTINGKPYRAYSRLYAFFPGKPGRFSLPVFTFEGYSRERTKGLPEDTAEIVKYAGLDLFVGEAVPLYLGETKKFHKLETKKETLRFEKRPKEFDGKWFLPAEQVSVYMKTEPGQTYMVGHPFILTIDVHTHGLFATQIPPINLFDTRDFKVYAEPETEHSQYDGKNVVGIRSRNFKVVPTKSGDLKLPLYKVTFYNTKTKLTETSSSKLMTLSVEKNPALREEEEKNLAQHKPSVPVTVAEAVSKGSLIPFIAGGLFAIFLCLLALLTVLILLPRIRFRKALNHGDFSAVQETLLRLKGVSSLSALKERYPKKKKLIERLEAASFGSKKDDSLIRDLKKAFIFFIVIFMSASFAYAEPSQEQVGEARYYGFLAGMAYGCKDVNLKRYEMIVGAVMRNQCKTGKDAEMILIDYTNAKRDGVNHQQQNKIKCAEFSKDFRVQPIILAELYPDGSVLMPDGKWVLARGVNSPPKRK